MSALMVNDNIDFNTLKDMLDLTDGNLASHLKVLEKQELIEVRKQFIGRKPNTNYRITGHGIKVFNQHLNALEKIINRS